MNALKRASCLLTASRATLRNNVCRRGILRTTEEVYHPPFVYRTAPVPPSKKVNTIATAVSAVMWYWILVHLWFEPDHITGHHAWPDVTKWTDEELGIPPLDEE